MYNSSGVKCTGGSTEADVDVISWIGLSRYDFSKDRSLLNKLKIDIDVPFKRLLDKKLDWKKYMAATGLADYVPKSYSILNASFPCVLKTNRHWARGVRVISNADELRSETKSLTYGKFGIEEA